MSGDYRGGLLSALETKSALQLGLCRKVARKSIGNVRCARSRVIGSGANLPARQASALRLTSSLLYCDRATAISARICLIYLRQVHFKARLRQVVALLL